MKKGCFPRFRRDAGGNIIILSAGVITIASMFCAFVLQVSRTAQMKETMEFAARYAARAAAVTLLPQEQEEASEDEYEEYETSDDGEEVLELSEYDERHAIKTAVKYYNANINRVIPRLVEKAVTVESMSRMVRINVVQDVQALFSFLPSQRIEVEAESSF